MTQDRWLKLNELAHKINTNKSKIGAIEQAIDAAYNSSKNLHELMCKAFPFGDGYGKMEQVLRKCLLRELKKTIKELQDEIEQTQAEFNAL